MKRLMLSGAAAMLMAGVMPLAAEAAPVGTVHAAVAQAASQPPAAVQTVEWYWRNHRRYWRNPPHRRAPPPRRRY